MCSRHTPAAARIALLQKPPNWWKLGLRDFSFRFDGYWSPPWPRPGRVSLCGHRDLRDDVHQRTHRKDFPIYDSPARALLRVGWNEARTNGPKPMIDKARMPEVSRGTSDQRIHGLAALRLHLDDLNTQMRLLPLNSRLRGQLISRIRDVEDQIERVEGI